MKLYSPVPFLHVVSMWMGVTVRPVRHQMRNQETENLGCLPSTQIHVTGLETPVLSTMASASIRDRYKVRHFFALKGEVRFSYPRTSVGPWPGRDW